MQLILKNGSFLKPSNFLKPTNAKMLAWSITGIFPLILLLVGIYFRIILGDFQNDPDYAYLLNGINILRFHAPAQIDHPGTPVQLIVGLISGFVWLIRTPFNGWILPADDVVLHPELYLLVISLVLNALASAALFVLGWRMFRYTGSPISAAVAQASIFFSFTALYLGLTKVAPEGLLLPLTLFLSAALVPAAFPSASPQPPQAGIIVGVLIGACLATKTNAMPLIFSIFIFRDRKMQVRTAAVAVLSAIIFTLPVAGKYREIFGYNWRMLTHNGRWGSGEQGMIAVSQYLTNIGNLYDAAPEIYISLTLCFILSILVSIGAVRSEKFELRRLLVVSAVMMIVQIAIVAKQGQGYYLAPVSGIVCLANGGICYLLLQGGIRRRMLGVAVVLALMAHGLRHGGLSAVAPIYGAAAAQREDIALQQRLAATTCRVVQGYESQTIPFKLLFGDNFADHQYLALLHKHYPDVIFYVENGRYFDTATGILKTADIDAWVGQQSCVYLLSSPLERFTPEVFGISPQHVTLIDRSQRGRVALYKIEPPTAGDSIFVKGP